MFTKHRLIVILYLVSCLLTFFFFGWTNYLFLYPLTWLGLVAVGVSRMRWNYFIHSFCEGKGDIEKKICLTFDDGPSEYTSAVLDLLEKYNQKGTFFCIGRQVEKFPRVFEKIIENNHEIGNHSYEHPLKMGFLSTNKVKAEIQKCDAVFCRFGVKTHLYRPPYGITNPSIAKAIRKIEKSSIGWNIRSFDTLQDGETKILARILPKIKNGAIVLLHDTSAMSVSVLESLLLFLEDNKYRSITISEMKKITK